MDLLLLWTINEYQVYSKNIKKIFLNNLLFEQKRMVRKCEVLWQLNKGSPAGVQKKIC